MIVFDLECSSGHTFEGWFDSVDSFADQNARDLVTCPYCEDANIKRVMSPVAVKRSQPQKPKAPRDSIDYHKLAREVVDYINKNFDNVGPKFAAEALKIHYGVAEKRNLRGFTTVEEEKILTKEGVEFFKIPVAKVKDEDKN